MRYPTIFLALFAILLSPAWAQANDAAPLQARGHIDAVTVYRGQALITRVLEIPGPSGLREIVVSDLPQHVVPGSLHAEATKGLKVRSLRYRMRPVQEDVRDEVREINEQMRTIGDDLTSNHKQVELITQHRAYLDRLDEFTAQTAVNELSKSVLDPGKLKEMSAYLFEERGKLTDLEIELSLAQRDLQEELDLFTRKRNAITGSSTRTAREAVVFVNVADDGGGTLRILYLVDQANWSPSYNIRTGGDHSQMKIDYYASIQQRSGEAWDNVKMTLSTATPSLAAQAPSLTPLTVSLQAIALNLNIVLDQEAYYENVQSIRRKQVALGRSRAIKGNKKFPPSSSIMGQILERQEKAGQLDFDKRLNALADELQLLELGNFNDAGIKIVSKPDLQFTEGISVTYELASRIHLPSRDDQQLLQIASIDIVADSYKLAMPVLTQYIYQEATGVNSSDLVLLAGPTSSYVDGQFVGHGVLPTVAAGESFTVGFGIDSSLRTDRELIAKQQTIQGGNQVVDLTYRLTVQNFNGHVVPVRLLDRLPVAKDADVKITLLSTSQPVSDDVKYKLTAIKDGILRWDIDVPVSAAGADVFTIEYKLRMEHDKQMTLAGGSNEQTDNAG